jgi:(S)-citramalyl-CoA lyase
MNGHFFINPIFVPATNLNWIDSPKNVSSDIIIVDLEDSVSPELKQSARESLANRCNERKNLNIVVRINKIQNQYSTEDIQLCAAHPQIVAVLLPKVETTDDIEFFNKLDKPIWLLIETALGLINLSALAQHKKTNRLVLGTLDLSANCGLMPESPEELISHNNARIEIIKNSIAFNLEPPLDGVCSAIHDNAKQKKHAFRARNFGFGGVLCIHPSQLLVVKECFKYSSEQIAWADEVVSTIRKSSGAASLNGQMIDAPVLKQAKRILALSN